MYKEQQHKDGTKGTGESWPHRLKGIKVFRSMFSALLFLWYIFPCMGKFQLFVTKC